MSNKSHKKNEEKFDCERDSRYSGVTLQSLDTIFTYFNAVSVGDLYDKLQNLPYNELNLLNGFFSDLEEKASEISNKSSTELEVRLDDAIGDYIYSELQEKGTPALEVNSELTNGAVTQKGKKYFKGSYTIDPLCDQYFNEEKFDQNFESIVVFLQKRFGASAVSCRVGSGIVDVLIPIGRLEKWINDQEEEQVEHTIDEIREKIKIEE